MTSHDPSAAARGAPADDAPSELGGYRLVELLGRGGMGEVWRAEREGVGGIRRRAAVKRILPRLRSDPALRQRFLAEARTNARLEHPNIVQVLDFGDQPEPYLVLEYVEGTTAADLLRDLARTQTKLPAIAAAFIAAEVATGLNYAHRKKDDDGNPLRIVHRDVSPQNVLISLDGAVKISDFGVARAADNTFRTREGASVGKLVYMAPEQVAGEPFDARADVFALGITFWELLTVTPLLPRDDVNAAMKQLLACDFPTPSQVDPHLPPMLDGLVMPALARNPADRYASAGAFAQAIRSFIHSISPGFDSTELTRILSKLLPSVAFYSNTPPPRGDVPRSEPMPHAAVPQRPPQPIASPAGGVAAIQQPKRAAQEMPVFQAPPGALAPHAAAAPAQPAPRATPADAQPAPRAPMPQTSLGAAPPGAMQGGYGAPHGGAPAPNASAPFAPYPASATASAPRGPAAYVTAPPDPNYNPVRRRGSSRPIVIGVVVGLLAVAIGTVIALTRGRDAAESSGPPPPAQTSNNAGGVPGTQLAPMAGVIAPGSAAQTPPTATPLVASDAGATAQPVALPGNPPPPSTPVPPPPPTPTNAPGTPQLDNPPTSARPSRQGASRPAPRNETSAVIQRQLGGLRGMVRACLGMAEGTGARVMITVVYDGAARRVVSVDTRGPGVIIGGSEARCVEETVRGAVRAEGGDGSVTVQHEYEF